MSHIHNYLKDPKRIAINKSTYTIPISTLELFVRDVKLNFNPEDEIFQNSMMYTWINTSEDLIKKSSDPKAKFALFEFVLGLWTKTDKCPNSVSKYTSLFTDQLDTETIKSNVMLNHIWKKEISELNEIDKEEDIEFFKAWLRAKYAETIRPGRKGAANEDFEKIGTRFHSWVRDNKEKLELSSSQDFYDFINKKMKFYANIYKMIDDAAVKWNQDLESIYYINESRLADSLSFPLLMAPITMQDDIKTIRKKMDLVATYLEMFVIFRSLNYRNYSHSSIRYTMYSLVKEIRDKSVEDLASILKEKAENIDEKLEDVENFAMHGQNKRFTKFILARITHFIEQGSKISSDFETYMRRDIAKPFQVEHIWADDWDQHKDEFVQRDEFVDYRNKLGALILLQEGFNQSYGALPYKEKLPHYYGQNLLAKSLVKRCYERNPSFMRFIEETGLPFKAHNEFKKKDIDQRQQLYQEILEQIYDLSRFDDIRDR